MINKLIDVHKQMIDRYELIIHESDFDDKEFLLNFCKAALRLKNPDKLSRWVGYLQGILIERKVLTVEHERNYSRNLYKPVYEQLGYDTTTIDVE